MMTDDNSGSLPQNASRGSHFLVTRVENSSQDISDLADNAPGAPEPPPPPPPPAADSNPSGNVIFKIGDASVFCASQLSTTVSLKTDSVEFCSTATLPADSINSGPLLQSHSSRFHIVKLESSSYKRGRWLCKDKQEPKILTDLPEKRKATATVQVQNFVPMEEVSSKDSPSSVAVVEPVSPSLASSLPGAVETKQPTASSASVNEDGGNALSPVVIVTDAQPTASSSSDHPAEPVVIQINGQLEEETAAPENDHAGVDFHMDALRLHGSSSSFIDSVVEQFGTDQIVKEFGSQAATAAGASPDSDVTSSDVAIDIKIEQAMDLVKTHLLYAVREEVDLFKERIEKLERASRRLEAENKVLREHVSAEVLAELNSILASKGFASTTPAPALAARASGAAGVTAPKPTKAAAAADAGEGASNFPAAPAAAASNGKNGNNVASKPGVG